MGQLGIFLRHLAVVVAAVASLKEWGPLHHREPPVDVDFTVRLHQLHATFLPGLSTPVDPNSEVPGFARRGGRLVQAALASITTSLSSTASASGRSSSFSQAATTTVATQLPIKLPSARTMPINQSTERTSTNPIAGMLGTAFRVAARITIADPGTPCAPFEVTSETAKTSNRSPIDSGVFVAWARNTTARVK